MNELIIGGRPVDTIEGLDINITKEVYSIIDPSKRKSDFTKTVKIPGSKVNDNIFSSLFDVNFSIRSATQLNPDFNPTKKASCVYYQDTFQQIKGYCQLEKITVLENNKVTYDIVIYGQVRTLFSDIANLTLNDLTTLGTAVWDDTRIIASWTDTFDATVKPCYPYLNRGKAVNWRGGPPNPVEWSYNYEAFKPWMYVKHILNAIIHEAGYSLEVAAFFETEQFQRLIMECDVKKFQQDQVSIAASAVDAYRSTDQTMSIFYNGTATNLAIWNNPIIWNIENADPLGQYNNTTGNLALDSTLAGVYYNIEAKFTAGVTYSGSASSQYFTVYIMLKRAGSYYQLKTEYANFSVAGFDVVPVTISLDSYQFQTGDEVRVCIGPFNDPALSVTDIEISQQATFDNYFKAYVDGQVEYGQTFDIAAVLPDMKQGEFLMGIFKMCNIYVDSIYTDQGLILEPRDDYFTDDVVDITDKLDVSKDFNIVPQGLLENKEILFTYSNNDDDLSRSYKQSVGYDYGYKRVIFDNDFVKDKKTLELPFSLVPLSIDTDFGNINMITMFDGNGAEKSNKPIIAYYGNMKAGYMVYWTQPGSRTVYNTYPYAGPVDDILAPSYDLCFGIQDLEFYTIQGGFRYTDNNLYNQFHRTQWQEIGSRDSKLIECYVKLNADDIQALSFRPKYWIDNAYYRLLGVYDYNPDGRSTTLCKFLKLDIYTPDAPAVVTKEGGNGQGGGEINIFKKYKDGILTGHGNNTDPNGSGVVVTGYGNSVGQGAANIIIQGNNNQVLPGIQNVLLLGDTNDLVITESDQVYINGVKYVQGTLTDGYVMAYDLATNTIKLEASSGGAGDSNIDGGTADSVYLPSQLIDGGDANG